MNKCKLGDLFYIKQGYAFKSEKYVSHSNYILCTLANFSESNNFKFSPEKATYYPDEFSHEFILCENDLIIPLTEQVVGLFGNTAFVPKTEEFQFVLNQRVGKIIPYEEKADKLFLHYLLSTQLVRDQIEATASGTKQRNTSPDKIYDVTVWVPNIDQQRIIGRYLYSLEQKCNVNNKICSELETMAKTLYDYWFVQFDFPDENGEPYRTAGGEMVWNEQLKRKIPKEWKPGKLCDIANITMGQSPAGESYNDAGDGLFFYQGRTDFGLRFPTPRMYTTAPTRFAQKGDILLSVRAPVGDLNFAMEDCCIGRGLAALNSKLGSQMHLFYTLAGFQQIFKVMDGNGTTFGSITKDRLFDMSVVIPPDEILMCFEKRVKPIESKVEKCEEEIRELTKLRDWLLPMLMNGQARVK